MEELLGLQESLKKARVILLTTYTENGEEHIRQMTNTNENPYTMMWFTTYTNTRKVEDVKKNPRVLLTVPATKRGEFYEIEGNAELEKQEVVEEKWSWWYLYWWPEQSDRFWFRRDGQHPDWAIINVHPISARLVKK